jgi:hypothetical protein
MPYSRQVTRLGDSTCRSLFGLRQPIWTAAAYLDCAAYSAFNDFRMGGGAFASLE